MKALSILVVLLGYCFSSSASTGVHIGSGVTEGLPSIYGISTGWYIPVQGAITINPRHIQKTAETMGDPIDALVWESQFGSISQTMHGLGFPMSGVNEKGLMIQATILVDQKYPTPPKGSHTLDSLQWIQYHLDTSASLSDVIAKTVTAVNPVVAFESGDFNVQYQVCDSQNCAIVSFYGQGAVASGSIGRFEINYSTGQAKSDASTKWALSAITNHTSDDSIAAYEQCKSFPCTSSDESLTRFFEAAQIAKNFEGKMDSPAYLSLQLLDDMKQVDQGLPLTTWNEVYVYTPDAGVMLSFKSPTRPITDRQWITLENFDFDCRQPTRMWWLNMDSAGGDRTTESIVHTRAEQTKLAQQHASEYSPSDLQYFIDYPEKKMVCLTK